MAPTKAEEMVAELETLYWDMLRIGTHIANAIRDLIESQRITPATNETMDIEQLIAEMRDSLGQMKGLEQGIKTEAKKLCNFYDALEKSHKSVTAENNDMARLMATLLNKLEIKDLKTVSDDLARRKDSALFERFQSMDCFDRLSYSGRDQDNDHCN